MYEITFETYGASYECIEIIKIKKLNLYNLFKQKKPIGLKK